MLIVTIMSVVLSMCILSIMFVIGREERGWGGGGV